ncbi:MAG: TonB family protein [Pseudomonadota bacterium]
MTQIAAKLLCVVASLGLHAVAFIAVPSGGDRAGGPQGQAGVTIHSAGVQTAALVASWGASPRVGAAPQSPNATWRAAPLPKLAMHKDARPKQATTNAIEPPSSEAVFNAPLPLDSAPVAVAAHVGTITEPMAAKAPAMPRLEIVRIAAPARPTSLSAPKADTAPKLETATSVLASIRPLARPQNVAPSFQTRAAGQSTASLAGDGRALADRSGLNDAQKRSLELAWTTSITREIQRAQRYPRGRHGDGRVLLSMVITRAGQLQGVRVKTSSGSSALDAAALAAVRRAAPFPAAPEGLTKSQYTADQWVALSQR